MDLFKIVKSVEPLIYEVMTWLILLPSNLRRTLAHPLRMMKYSEGVQRKAAEEQYTDTVSPPLFPLLSLLVAHALELVTHAEILQARWLTVLLAITPIRAALPAARTFAITAVMILSIAFAIFAPK